MLQQLNPKHKAPRVLLNDEYEIKYQLTVIGSVKQVIMTNRVLARALILGEPLTLTQAERYRDELQQESYNSGFTHEEVRYAIRPIRT